MPKKKVGRTAPAVSHQENEGAGGLMAHLADVFKRQFTKVSQNKEEIEETAVATVAGETVEFFATPILTPIGGIILGALVGCTTQHLIHNHHVFHG